MAALGGLDAGITARPAPGKCARKNVGYSAEGRGLARHGHAGFLPTGNGKPGRTRPSCSS